MSNGIELIRWRDGSVPADSDGARPYNGQPLRRRCLSVRGTFHGKDLAVDEATPAVDIIRDSPPGNLLFAPGAGGVGEEAAGFGVAGRLTI